MTARILVVDDSVVMRALIESVVRQLGEVEVVQAVDGADALTKLDGVRLVITDLTMPEVDGGELVARIRALPGPAAQVPIILLTTKSNAAEAAAALSAGADASLAKPIDRVALLDTSRRLLDRP